MKVRAVQTVKYGSIWHIPGTKTEIFDVPEAVYDRLRGAVEVVRADAMVEEVTLPDDLPYRHILIGLGIETTGAIPRNLDDLLALRGIGQKSAAAILNFLGVQ
jgi:hypothetical protein